MLSWFQRRDLTALGVWGSRAGGGVVVVIVVAKARENVIATIEKVVRVLKRSDEIERAINQHERHLCDDDE